MIDKKLFVLLGILMFLGAFAHTEAQDIVPETPWDQPQGVSTQLPPIPIMKEPETPWEQPEGMSKEAPQRMVETPWETAASAFIPSVAEEEKRYRLKVGDTMLLSLYGEENTTQEIVVDPRGKVSYLFAQSIDAAGKTVEQLRAILKKDLEKYYRFVTLSITPIKFNAEYYTITGEVNKPGKKPIVGRPTVLSAICKAEGLSVVDYRDQIFEMSDLDKAFLARKGAYVPVDFQRLIRQGDLSQDLPLQAGDYIYIPNRTIKQVFVLGEVYGATTIDYFNEMTLAGAIAEAGEVTEAASSRVAVIRGSLACPIRFMVDYPQIVKGCAPDFPLLPGDIVFVPPRKLNYLRDIFRAAVATFVGTVADEAGVEAFIHVHPHAATDFDNREFTGGGTVSLE